jgi:hypothetical protein
MHTIRTVTDVIATFDGFPPRVGETINVAGIPGGEPAHMPQFRVTDIEWVIGMGMSRATITVEAL